MNFHVLIQRRRFRTRRIVILKIFCITMLIDIMQLIFFYNTVRLFYYFDSNFDVKYIKKFLKYDDDVRIFHFFSNDSLLLQCFNSMNDR